jgi:hypothetical protein
MTKHNELENVPVSKHTMKAYGETEKKAHTSLISASDGEERSV